MENPAEEEGRPLPQTGVPDPCPSLQQAQQEGQPGGRGTPGGHLPGEKRVTSPVPGPQNKVHKSLAEGTEAFPDITSVSFANTLSGSSPKEIITSTVTEIVYLETRTTSPRTTSPRTASPRTASPRTASPRTAEPPGSSDEAFLAIAEEAPGTKTEAHVSKTEVPVAVSTKTNLTSSGQKTVTSIETHYVVSSETDVASSETTVASSESNVTSVASSENNVSSVASSKNAASSENTMASSVHTVTSSENALASSETAVGSSVNKVTSSENVMASSEISKDISVNTLLSSKTAVASSENVVASSETAVASSETAVASSVNKVTSSEISKDISVNRVLSSKTAVASSETAVASSETAVASSETAVASSVNKVTSSEISKDISVNRVPSSKTTLASSENAVASSEAALASSVNTVVSSEIAVAISENTVTSSETALASSVNTVTSSETAVASSLNSVGKSETRTAIETPQTDTKTSAKTSSSPKTTPREAPGEPEADSPAGASETRIAKRETHVETSEVRSSKTETYSVTRETSVNIKTTGTTTEASGASDLASCEIGTTVAGPGGPMVTSNRGVAPSSPKPPSAKPEIPPKPTTVSPNRPPGRDIPPSGRDKPPDASTKPPSPRLEVSGHRTEGPGAKVESPGANVEGLGAIIKDSAVVVVSSTPVSTPSAAPPTASPPPSTAASSAGTLLVAQQSTADSCVVHHTSPSNATPPPSTSSSTSTSTTVTSSVLGDTRAPSSVFVVMRASCSSSTCTSTSIERKSGFATPLPAGGHQQQRLLQGSQGQQVVAREVASVASESVGSGGSIDGGGSSSAGSVGVVESDDLVDDGGGGGGGGSEIAVSFRRSVMENFRLSGYSSDDEVSRGPTRSRTSDSSGWGALGATPPGAPPSGATTSSDVKGARTGVSWVGTNTSRGPASGANMGRSSSWDEGVEGSASPIRLDGTKTWSGSTRRRAGPYENTSEHFHSTRVIRCSGKTLSMTGHDTALLKAGDGIDRNTVSAVITRGAEAEEPKEPRAPEAPKAVAPAKVSVTAVTAADDIGVSARTASAGADVSVISAVSAGVSVSDAAAPSGFPVTTSASVDSDHVSSCVPDASVGAGSSPDIPKTTSSVLPPQDAPPALESSAPAEAPRDEKKERASRRAAFLAAQDFYAQSKTAKTTQRTFKTRRSFVPGEGAEGDGRPVKEIKEYGSLGRSTESGWQGSTPSPRRALSVGDAKSDDEGVGSSRGDGSDSPMIATQKEIANVVSNIVNKGTYLTLRTTRSASREGVTCAQTEDDDTTGKPVPEVVDTGSRGGTPGAAAQSSSWQFQSTTETTRGGYAERIDETLLSLKGDSGGTSSPGVYRRSERSSMSPLAFRRSESGAGSPLVCRRNGEGSASPLVCRRSAPGGNLSPLVSRRSDVFGRQKLIELSRTEEERTTSTAVVRAEEGAGTPSESVKTEMKEDSERATEEGKEEDLKTKEKTGDAEEESQSELPAKGFVADRLSIFNAAVAAAAGTGSPVVMRKSTQVKEESSTTKVVTRDVSTVSSKEIERSRVTESSSSAPAADRPRTSAVAEGGQAQQASQTTTREFVSGSRTVIRGGSSHIAVSKEEAVTSEEGRPSEKKKTEGPVEGETSTPTEGSAPATSQPLRVSSAQEGGSTTASTTADREKEQVTLVYSSGRRRPAQDDGQAGTDSQVSRGTRSTVTSSTVSSSQTSQQVQQSYTAVRSFATPRVVATPKKKDVAEERPTAPSTSPVEPAKVSSAEISTGSPAEPVKTSAEISTSGQAEPVKVSSAGISSSSVSQVSSISQVSQVSKVSTVSQVSSQTTVKKQDSTSSTSVSPPPPPLSPKPEILAKSPVAPSSPPPPPRPMSPKPVKLPQAAVSPPLSPRSSRLSSSSCVSPTFGSRVSRSSSASISSTVSISSTSSRNSPAERDLSEDEVTVISYRCATPNYPSNSEIRSDGSRSPLVSDSPSDTEMTSDGGEEVIRAGLVADRRAIFSGACSPLQNNPRQRQPGGGQPPSGQERLTVEESKTSSSEARAIVKSRVIVRGPGTRMVFPAEGPSGSLSHSESPFSSAGKDTATLVDKARVVGGSSSESQAADRRTSSRVASEALESRVVHTATGAVGSRTAAVRSPVSQFERTGAESRLVTSGTAAKSQIATSSKSETAREAAAATTSQLPSSGETAKWQTTTTVRSSKLAEERLKFLRRTIAEEGEQEVRSSVSSPGPLSPRGLDTPSSSVTPASSRHDSTATEEGEDEEARALRMRLASSLKSHSKSVDKVTIYADPNISKTTTTIATQTERDGNGVSAARGGGGGGGAAGGRVTTSSSFSSISSLSSTSSSSSTVTDVTSTQVTYRRKLLNVESSSSSSGTKVPGSLEVPGEAVTSKEDLRGGRNRDSHYLSVLFQDDDALEEALREFTEQYNLMKGEGSIMSVERRGTKALELWARRATDGYPGVSVTNMTTSWRDGLAFCALIHHFRPDLIDFQGLKAEEALENNAQAFRIAEQQLGIPALLDAEDMVEASVPDRLSILTYVSQFYQTFAAQGLTSPSRRAAAPDSRPSKPAPPPASQPRALGKQDSKTDKVLCSSRGSRELCVMCNEAVYLAQRLLVGSPGLLMHRTCFKCARCNSQLNLASYYETEKGQYCCETCPDEENTAAANRLKSTTNNSTDDTATSQQPQHLPKIDLDTDSEDSASEDEDEEEESCEDRDEDDVYSKNSEKIIEEQTAKEPVEEATPIVPKPRSIFLAKTLLDQETSEVTTNNNTPKSPNIIPNTNLNKVSSALFGPTAITTKQSTTEKSSSHTDSLTDTDTSTKPSGPTTCHITKATTISCPPEISATLDTGQGTRDSDGKHQKEESYRIEEESVKFSRVSSVVNKFNKLAKDKDSDKEEDTAEKTRFRSCATLEMVINGKEDLDPYVDSDEEKKKSQDVQVHKDSLPSITLSTAKEDLEEPPQDRIPHQEEEEKMEEEKMEEESDEYNPFGDEDEEPDESGVSVSQSQTCSDEREVTGDITTVSKDSGASVGDDASKDSGTSVVDDVQYPDELNPFGDDDEEEEEEEEEKEEEIVTKPEEPKQKKLIKAPLNPFESDEDDKEEEESEMPSMASKKSLNPFWSDDEEPDDEEEDLSLTPSKRKPRPPRPPPPTLSRNSTLATLAKSEHDIQSKQKVPPPKPPHPKDAIPTPSPAGSPQKVSPQGTPKSTHSGSAAGTVRLKKKIRPAPVPPGCGTSPQLGRASPTSTCDTASITTDSASVCSLGAESLPSRPSAHQGVPTKTNKSEMGEWRRKKGPAPLRPVPQKRNIKKLPMRAIQTELHDIEVQQTGLERQGVLLEQAIRERTEDKNNEPDNSSGPNSIEVEDMILQLFELVNEKNELFRRQTELMYLKREKRLEEEYAELEYQIRCLMLKAPKERSEEDTAHEEELIARLVKVVEQRDEIINCLELDRLREAQEDESIATQMMKYQEKHIDGIESPANGTLEKPKKKKALKLPKKKKKEKVKKDKKGEKVDADKDVDEVEAKEKKKKKKWFLSPKPN
ncbi:MICAL-like protein isoform X2 [Oratosquilla oratoria]|uniref:MICAL-like protein isoform X2 n=1 Tax=Oratosquilla oratoria TaxID=337810 RepID=UPI003F758276